MSPYRVHEDQYPSGNTESIVNEVNCFSCPGTLAVHCIKRIERKDTATSNFVFRDLTWTFLGWEYFALCSAQQALELNMLCDVYIKCLFSIADTRQNELYLLALHLHAPCGSQLLLLSFLCFNHICSQHQQFVSLVKPLAPPLYLLPHDCAAPEMMDGSLLL